MLSINVVQREPAMYFCGRVSENTKLYMNKEAEIGFVKKNKKTHRVMQMFMSNLQSDVFQISNMNILRVPYLCE